MMLPRLMTLALIVQLLSAPVTSGMLVLCFGSDGHVAVESASASLCCREWDEAHGIPAGDLPVKLESTSGPCCNDLELSIDSATLTVPAQKVVPASAVLCSVPVPALPLPSAAGGILPLSIESPVAASLRTVVLRA
jgi:hypothetical protein